MALALLAIALPLFVWAAFAARPISNESHAPALLVADPASLNAVAYALPGPSFDEVFVRPADGETVPVHIAQFPHIPGLHVRGSASPTGKMLAVLSVPNYPGTSARLTLIDLNDLSRREIEAEFEYLSRIAWAPDGSRLAATGYGETGESAARSVLEVDVATGRTTPIARFEEALEVAPAGYSATGARLYIVLIDQSGSSLWAERGTILQRVGQLSAGRTRDWNLSPDGARLAYIDIRADTAKPYAGRTMLLATGVASSAVGEGTQLGTAWFPGSEMADFGGPGGSLRLTAPGRTPSLVVPISWSPDGTRLLARISEQAPGSESYPGAIEVATRDSRIRIAEGTGAWAFGWVRDLE